MTIFIGKIIAFATGTRVGLTVSVTNGKNEWNIERKRHLRAHGIVVESIPTGTGTRVKALARRDVVVPSAGIEVGFVAKHDVNS